MTPPETYVDALEETVRKLEVKRLQLEEYVGTLERQLDEEIRLRKEAESRAREMTGREGTVIDYGD